MCFASSWDSAHFQWQQYKAPGQARLRLHKYGLVTRFEQVMASAPITSQGSSSCNLQQMADQAAERSAFSVCSRLEGLVELPVRGKSHPDRLAAQQIGWAGCSRG